MCLPTHAYLDTACVESGGSVYVYIHIVQCLFLMFLSHVPLAHFLPVADIAAKKNS